MFQQQPLGRRSLFPRQADLEVLDSSNRPTLTSHSVGITARDWCLAMKAQLLGLQLHTWLVFTLLDTAGLGYSAEEMSEDQGVLSLAEDM
ncbi:hypothetical protein AAY473_004896 [Plecturocebus cupreus]